MRTLQDVCANCVGEQRDEARDGASPTQNASVPQVAEWIARRILDAETATGEAMTADARLTDLEKGTARGSATNSSSADASPAQAEQEIPREQAEREVANALMPLATESYVDGLKAKLAQAAQEIATLKAERDEALNEARILLDGMDDLSIALLGSKEQPAAAMRVRIEQLRAAEQARAALRALVEKIDAVHADSRYVAVWALYQIHGGRYTEPTYTAELDAARAVLRSPVERTRDEEKDLTRQSSASTAPGMGISAIPTRKAPGDD